MGDTRHHGILVTTWDKKLMIVAHAKAFEFFPIDLVSEVSAEQTNGYRSFAIFPDGSNEGWPESIDRDENRREFKAWLNTQRYEDGSTSLHWVEVQYGDDNHETGIVADSDHPEETVVDAVVMLPE